MERPFHHVVVIFWRVVDRSAMKKSLIGCGSVRVDVVTAFRFAQRGRVVGWDKGRVRDHTRMSGYSLRTALTVRPRTTLEGRAFGDPPFDFLCS